MNAQDTTRPILNGLVATVAIALTVLPMAGCTTPEAPAAPGTASPSASAAAVVRTIAGSANNVAGSVDGVGDAASFSRITGIAAGPSGLST